MNTYIAKSGDTVSSIAIQFKITETVLLNDNPFLVGYGNYLRGGEIVRIRPVEDMIDLIVSKSEKVVADASLIIEERRPSDIMDYPLNEIEWNGYTVTTAVIGVVSVNRPTDLLIEVGVGETQKTERLIAEQSFTVKDIREVNGVLHYDVGGGKLIKAEDAMYYPLPEEERNKLNALVTVEPPPKREQVSNNLKDPHKFPNSMTHSYRRSRLQVSSGKSTYTIELRVMNVNRSRNYEYSPNRTNAGWTVHVGGKGLPVISVSCYWLDTLTNRESKDYDKIFNKYMAPRNESDFFSSPLVSFLHKGTEYKGFILSDSLSDDSNQPLTQSFNFSFLVLSENNLQEGNGTKMVIDRGKIGEHQFLSDINNVFKNVVTGE